MGNQGRVHFQSYRLFIARAERSQSRQQLRRSAVPPPCKQVSHRSPSQSAPGRSPASWPSAGPGLQTQSPAQKATTEAGPVHHMLSEPLQTPRHLRPPTATLLPPGAVT